MVKKLSAGVIQRSPFESLRCGKWATAMCLREVLRCENDKRGTVKKRNRKPGACTGRNLARQEKGLEAAGKVGAAAESALRGVIRYIGKEVGARSWRKKRGKQNSEDKEEFSTCLSCEVLTTRLRRLAN